MNHAGLTISLEVEFEEDGFVRGMSGQRHRTESKRCVRRPWQVQASDYRETSGLRLPHQLEAAWIEDDGEQFTYFREEVMSLDLEFAVE